MTRLIAVALMGLTVLVGGAPAEAAVPVVPTGALVAARAVPGGWPPSARGQASAPSTPGGAVRAVVASVGPGWPGPWRPPLTAPTITARFDLPEHNWRPGHRGIDLRAAPGTVVRAAGAGRVRYAGLLAGRGVVVIDHGEVRTTYEPVAARVRVGQVVRAGAVIGRIATGTGHCGSGACLHLGLRRGPEYLDPTLLLGSARAVLVPW